MIHHESISASENVGGFFCFDLAFSAEGAEVGAEGKRGLGGEDDGDVNRGGGRSCVGSEGKARAEAVGFEVVS